MMIAITILVLVVSVVFHEVAHGVVARLFGDTTAQRAGRLTLNPIPHVDIFGSVVLPGLLILTHAPFLFGYAKPVPVNFNALKPTRLGLIAVAAAGPLTNVVLAAASAIGIMHTENNMMREAFGIAFRLNLVLAVFNMIPILPMDGGRVLFGILPTPLGRLYARLEPYGMLFILLLLASPFIFSQLGLTLNPMAAVMLPPLQWLQDAIVRMVG